MKNQKLIAFNYFGGKYQWVNQLYPLFPKHLHFVDLFCGSMAVTLNKVPSKLDTANDKDGIVMNFFNVLRDKPEELIRSLELTPIGRESYTKCWPISQDEFSDVEIARRFFVRCRQSFQGSGLKESTGFNACIATSERGISKNVSKYLSAVDKLPSVVQRLKNIQFENLDYSLCVQKYDRPGTFFYVDPPYELRKRGYKKWYNTEFESDQEHIDLALKLNQIEGKAMVSGYKSEMYMDLYKDWFFTPLVPKGHSMKGAKLQEECVWTNYNPEVL